MTTMRITRMMFASFIRGGMGRMFVSSRTHINIGRVSAIAIPIKHTIVIARVVFMRCVRTAAAVWFCICALA